MSRRWVIDASLGLAWIHPHQASAQTDTLLREVGTGITLLVPALWFLEVANALLVLERRRRIKGDERREALATLRALNINADFEGVTSAFGHLSDLAEKHRLSVYDAAYLELAMREHLPLGTVDAALQEAAGRVGVNLLVS
jgi:predicted nucleic acid-binding protein